MKSTKNIFIPTFVIVAALCGSQITAENPNFEIWNKTNNPIRVTIKALGLGVRETIQAGEKHSRTVNNQSNNKIDLIIEATKPGSILFSEWKCTLTPNGKTVYLSWDTNKRLPLYPQTGQLMGLMGRYNPFFGKTKSGLPLENNISEGEISIEEKSYH